LLRKLDRPFRVGTVLHTQFLASITQNIEMNRLDVLYLVVVHDGKRSTDEQTRDLIGHNRISHFT
jgi:acetylglutamate kinase